MDGVTPLWFVCPPRFLSPRTIKNTLTWGIKPHPLRAFTTPTASGHAERMGANRTDLVLSGVHTIRVVRFFCKQVCCRIVETQDSCHDLACLRLYTN